MNNFRCICGSKFKSYNAKKRHKKSGKCPEGDSKMQFKDLPADVRRDVLDIVGEDFSDGAYFALAEEMGVDF